MYHLVIFSLRNEGCKRARKSPFVFLNQEGHFLCSYIKGFNMVYNSLLCSGNL